MIVRRRFMLGMLSAITFLVVGAAGERVQAAAGAPQACRQWNITGAWATSQANNFHVTFHFKQTGTTLAGTATLPAAEAASLGYATGKLTGTVKGSHLALTMTWKNGPTAAYIATVSKGALKGSGRAIATPSNAWTSWWGNGPTRCVQAG